MAEENSLTESHRSALFFQYAIVRFFTAIIILLVFPFSSYAETETSPDASPKSSGTDVFSFHAHFKDVAAWLRTDAYSKTHDTKDLFANLTRIRLSPELNVSDIITLHVDYDNEIISGNYLKSAEFDSYWRNPDAEFNDVLHATWEIAYTNDYLYRNKIHRAYAKAVFGDFTFSAGRQQFRFGSGRLWNPLDILNPINPISFEGASEQKGTDGASAEYFINEKTSISAVICPRRINDEFNEAYNVSNSNALGRLKMNIAIAEIAVLGGRLPDREAFGGDISLIVFGGTLRGSALYTREESLENTIVASAGFEYTFSWGLYVLLEYFYNSAALNREPTLLAAYGFSLASGYDEATNTLLANRFLTCNRHYAALALGYDITPLVRAELFSIYDHEGKFMLLNPSLKYNLHQDIDISCAVMAARKTGETSNTSELAFVEKHPLVYAMFTWFFL